AALAKGVVWPRSFQLVDVADAAAGPAPKFTFAYISDTHLYEQSLNDRFGGDLAQLGQVKELELGAQILKGVKAPIKMMVGEHDWFLDMGDKWKQLFG